MNVLDIPGFNQERTSILREMKRHISSGVSMLLPFAALIETGNHIAQLPNGGLRRKYAKLFVETVRSAMDGAAPWTPTRSIDVADLMRILDEYTDSAARGVGIGDLSILKEWQDACEMHPHFRVLIWTIDSDLAGYDRMPH